MAKKWDREKGAKHMPAISRDDRAMTVYAGIERWTQDGLPVIQGHELSLAQWDAFVEWIATGSFELAADKAGVQVRTVWVWRRQPWWNYAMRTMFEDSIDRLKHGMAERVPKALVMLDKLLDGELDDKKGLNGVVALFSKFLEMGDNPVINKRNLVLKQSTTINTISPVTANELQGWTQDQIAVFARTGQRPGEQPGPQPVLDITPPKDVVPEGPLEGALPAELDRQSGAGGQGSSPPPESAVEVSPQQTLPAPERPSPDGEPK